MPELDIGLVDGGELNFDQSFLEFNIKKKIHAKSSSRFDFKNWILETAILSSYCYNNTNFTIPFLGEKDNFLRCKVHSVRHTSLTFTKVKLCKRPEVNNKPTHFLNNGKTFLSLDNMICRYQCPDQFQLLPWCSKPKCIGFHETFKNPIY